MAERLDRPDPRALAIAWWCSRSSTLDGDAAVDLETLDQWRQGRLTPRRASSVKRQLGDDPRLMRMLEELVAADDALGAWEAEAQAPEPPLNAWERLRRLADQVRARLREPIWAGGLVAVTASLVLVALLPVLTTPSLDRRLDQVYAALDAPEQGVQLPFGPRIAIRGGTQTEPESLDSESRRLAQQAFQVGMRDGIEQLRTRAPQFDPGPAEPLSRDLPDCAVAVQNCEPLVELARISGRWALAAYLQCRGLPATDQPRALDLLPELQAAWRDAVAEHPLANALQSIAVHQNPCEGVQTLIRTWGR